MAFPLTFFNSPVAQCQPATLQWAGGLPPYAVAALDARFGGIGGALIAQVVTGAQNSVFQWDKAALPAGAQVVFQVQDSTGKTAQTNPIAVAESDDTSCLPASLQPAPTATFSTRSLVKASPSEASATDTTTDPPGASQSFANAQKSHSGSHTGLILAVVGCSIVTLAIVSALWYWHISRRKTASLVSRIGPPLPRAETPMWGNMSATRSDLKLTDAESAAGSDNHPQQYQPQSIVPVTSLPPPTQRPRPQPRLASIDITAAYSYPVSPPLYSPPPPGGLTPMPPPRPSARGTRSGAPRP
ncbi:hypothetical protein AURDEDRAFT_159039 [Auricularia subglabra TFB-10046 SS5]|nr:hypothetical protein AURDEDRAFT_159039 [Auricularia subglabra TFB-10046 SS5]